MMKETTFSFSKIDQFMRCPLAYKMINLEENNPSFNQYMNAGTMAHRFMELSWNHPKDDVISILHKEFKDFTTVRDISLELTHYVPDIYSHCVAAELPISFQLGPYYMRGIIDRLDMNENGIYRIVDYKYGFYEYKKEDLDNSIQLSLYAYHIMNDKNSDKCEISYHNLKQNTIVTKEINKQSIDIQSIISFIVTIRNSELLNDFPARLSGNCMNCVVRMKCDPFKEWISSSIPNVPDPDISVEKLLEYYYDIQEREKSLRYQKKALYPIMQEIMKSSSNPMDNYSLNLTKYGNIEIKKMKS